MQELVGSKSVDGQSKKQAGIAYARLRSYPTKQERRGRLECEQLRHSSGAHYHCPRGTMMIARPRYSTVVEVRLLLLQV